MRGYALVSQDIRRLIFDGRLITQLEILDKSPKSIKKQEDVESRIQPSSFEPVIEDKVFILDTDVEGLFRGCSTDTIYRNLLRLPKRRRQEVSISDGFQINVGSSYLFPLREKVRLEDSERMRSSPKSTRGRDFINSRLLADFHAEYDEVRSRGDTFLDLWLLIQPLAFNFIVYPGLTFNQLRFFRGLNPNLSESEIVREHKESPLLLYDNNSELVAADIRHGELTLTLNLEARSTSGVAALQARRNPIPIDLSEKGGVISEDYFEPVLCKDRKFSPKPGGYYLLSSNEILSIPPHLNAELKSTHHTGIHGLWDFAGFIDNTFKGNLVFELRSDEGLYALLEHGTPVSLLDIFRCRTKPDKRYGSKIQSHYQDQRGPKVSKHHTDFDFRRAAKEYAKLDKLVLVEQKEILLGLRNKETGLEYVALDHSKRIIEKCSKGFFLSRYDCEDDKKVLQLIPYVLIYGRDETVLTYRRASSIKEYGDSRLFGKQSIGLGGHVTKLDGPNYITGALERELSEEVKFLGKHSEPRLVGTLYQPDLPVDKVHFGLVYVVYTDSNVISNERSVLDVKMRRIQDLVDNKRFLDDSETWTRVLIPELPNIMNRRRYSPHISF